MTTEFKSNKTDIIRHHKSLLFDLQMALMANDLCKIKSIIESIHELKLNINAKFISGSTPLCYAVNHRLFDATRILLIAGCDPNIRSRDEIGRNEPPLCSAIRIGDISTIKLLLSCGAIDVNESDFFGQTPLWWSVKERNHNFVKLIIHHSGFKLQTLSFDRHDTNPLYLACKYVHRGRVKCAKELIRYGFNVNSDIINFILLNPEHKIELIHMIIESEGIFLLKKLFANDFHHSLFNPLSLKKLTRIVLRNTFKNRTQNLKPLTIDNLTKFYSIIPEQLIQYLIMTEFQ